MDGPTLYIEDHVTNFDLGAFGKSTIYSLKLPYSVRTEIAEIGEEDVSTPRRDKIFGWFKLFQVITSLYALWKQRKHVECGWI